MLEAIEYFEKGKKVKYKRKRKTKKSKAVLIKIVVPVMLLFLLAFAGYYFDFFSLGFVEEKIESAIISELSVNTNPENATIYLNNDSIGQTPLNAFSLQEGNYSLKMERINFKTIDTIFTVMDGKNLALNFNLSPVEKIVKKEVDVPPKKSAVATVS